LQLAATMGSLPADYFQYYYFTDEILAELRERPTTRAQDIMASVPDYWSHYAEQARAENPQLEPSRSRGGFNELELAVDVLDAYFNDRGTVWPVNVVNIGTIPDLPADAVVEVPAVVDRSGFHPISYGPLPPQGAGLVKMLGQYQMLTAEAAWCGSREDAVRALMSHPWMVNPEKAAAVYGEMSRALARYLPERLVA
jgi:6-phospho-beta-glucosidase